MDTKENEFLVRNMSLRLGTTPAKHVLLAHVNLSLGWKIHQGLK